MLDIQKIPRIVINLPERTDRLGAVRSELEYLLWDTSFHLIEGVLDKNPMLGIAQAHLNAVKKAREEKWPYVLIMEDDVKFQAKEKTRAYAEEAFNDLPEEWDILLGGVYESDGLKSFNNYWNKTKQFCGLHWYILPEIMYDRMLTYDGRHHIDRWINMTDDLNCYVAKKFFATQHDGFSDNIKGKTDYSNKLSKFELLK